MVEIVLAVVGSRTITDYDFVKGEIDLLYNNNIEKIISGGSKGVDSLAERYAEENNIEILVIKPDWKKYGKAAGVIRNKDIISNATHVIAFQQNKSKGTQNSINHARKMNKILHIIEID